MTNINPSKLLPPSPVGGALVKTSPIKGITKNNFFAKKKTIDVESIVGKKKQDFSDKVQEDVYEIKLKVIDIEKMLKSSFAAQKADAERKRRQKQKEKFDKKEKDLEKKPTKEDLKKPKVPTPKGGIFDWIKNFIFNTILGFLAVRLIEHLPTAIKFLGVALQVGDFLTDIAGKLLNGLVTFIDWGYKAIDATRGFIKSIGGENFAQMFDKFAGAIDNVLEVAVIAALVTADSMWNDNGGGGGPSRGGRRGFDSTGRRVGTDAQRRYAQRFGRDQFVDRFGRNNLRNLPGGMRRGALQRGVRSAFVGLAGKGGAKAILGFVRPLLKRLPIIGALIDFGLSVALGEDPGRAAFKAIGAALLGSVGAAIGSLAFGFGGIVGGILGSIGGDAIGGALYDAFFKNKKPKPQEKANKLAGGGQPKTSRKTKPRSRRRAPKKLKPIKTKRTITAKQVKAPQINPGKDVGGQQKLFGIFPNPFATSNTTTNEDKTKKPDPFGFMRRSSVTYSKIDFFGPIMTLASNLLLGQKPSMMDYENVALGINSLIQEGMNRNKLKGGIISAFSEGGMVSSDVSEGDADMTKWIADAAKDSIFPKIDSVTRDLMKNMLLKKQEEDLQKAPDPSDMGEGAGVQVSSDSEDFWLLATAAMFENSHPQGAADVAQVIYNRTQYPAWNAPTIRKAILNPGQFQPVRQYGGTAAWASIKTKQDALRFSRSHGKTQEQLERVAASLLDKQKQQDARSFVGPRDSFRSDSYEAANNHLANETEVKRHGHTFGFEPGGAMIGQFKAGKLSAAQVNENIKGDVSSDVSGLDSGTGGPMVRSERGTRISGELGKFLKQSGVGSWGSGVWQHPSFGGSDRRSYPSWHNVDRAIDVGGNWPADQKQILPKVQEFNRKNNVRPVELLYGKPGTPKSDSHRDHVHVAYHKGGETLPFEHIAKVGEEGPEYVIDAKSYQVTEKLLPGVLDTLNYLVYDKASMKKHMNFIVSSLQKYAPYETKSGGEIVLIDDGDGTSSSGSQTPGAFSIPSDNNYKSSYDPFNKLVAVG